MVFPCMGLEIYQRVMKNFRKEVEILHLLLHTTDVIG